MQTRSSGILVTWLSYWFSGLYTFEGPNLQISQFEFLLSIWFLWFSCLLWVSVSKSTLNIFIRTSFLNSTKKSSSTTECEEAKLFTPPSMYIPNHLLQLESHSQLPTCLSRQHWAAPSPPIWFHLDPELHRVPESGACSVHRDCMLNNVDPCKVQWSGVTNLQSVCKVQRAGVRSIYSLVHSTPYNLLRSFYLEHSSTLYKVFWQHTYTHPYRHTGYHLL